MVTIVPLLTILNELYKILGKVTSPLILYLAIKTFIMSLSYKQINQTLWMLPNPQLGRMSISYSEIIHSRKLKK